MRGAWVFLFALLAAQGAHAQPYDGFSANILIVKSHREVANWVKLDPAKRKGDAGRIRTVTRGSKFYVPIIATFARSQVDQPIALVADFEISGPAGNGQKMAGCCHADRVDPRAPTTIVLNPVVDVTFDSTDPVGEYKLRARLSDGRKTVVVEETIFLQ